MAVHKGYEMERANRPGDRGFRGTEVPGEVQSRKGLVQRLKGLLQPTKRKFIITGAALVPLVAAVVILNSVYSVALVDGYSMYPTYQSGDLVIINKHQNPEIHNVVTAKVDVYQSGDILKRLSGMPGHTVSPNGREKRLLQQNEYWLASDANRYTGTEGTTDSNDFGPVAREDITGVVVWKTRFAQGLLEDPDVIEQFRQAQVRHKASQAVRTR